jgi:hypothetical protein
MVEHFPAKRFSFSQCQVYIVSACIIVLKNDTSFHEVPLTKCMSQFLGHLNVVNSIGSLFVGRKLTNQGYSFGFVLLWRCSMMPFHILSFWFGVATVEPASITSYVLQKEVITHGGMPLKQLLSTHPYVLFCVHLGEDLSSNTLSGIPQSSQPLHSVVSNAKPCYSFLNGSLSFFFDEHINIMLV